MVYDIKIFLEKGTNRPAAEELPTFHICSTVNFIYIQVGLSMYFTDTLIRKEFVAEFAAN